MKEQKYGKKQLAIVTGSTAGIGFAIAEKLAAKDFEVVINGRDHVSEEQVEKDFFRSVRPTSLLRRLIRTEEVGAFVAFLCGEEASAVTGAALRVDGGVVKSII